MSDWTMKELADKISDIDFVMLATHTEDGQIAARPMSNNGDVEYDGDSYFFSYEKTRTIDDIKRQPKVAMTVQGKAGLLGKPPVFVAIEAVAEIIKDKAQFEKHWKTELKRWFPDGVDTAGLVLLKVHAGRITHWDGEDEGQVKV